MVDHPTLHGDRRRAGSFGDDAEQYDRVRPPYPDHMIDRLMGQLPCSVLDVGCGTGIASRLFAARGADVLGLEPDPRMASVARRHGLEVEDGTIEEWDPGGRRFDRLVADQSWHWVDPRPRAAKAATVLRAGGRFGLFWNQPHPGADVAGAIHAAYAAQAPELGRSSVLLGRRSPSSELIAAALAAHPAFDDVSV
jgi:SAM-dependent methyltransferase